MRALVIREETDDQRVSVEFIDREAIVALNELDQYYASDFRSEVERQLLPLHFRSWDFVCDLSEGGFDEELSWEAVHVAQDRLCEQECPEFKSWWPDVGVVYDVQFK